MGRNTRAKKKTPDDKKKKFYISQRELEKTVIDAKREATSDAFIVMLAAVRDCKGLELDEVYEIAETVMRYSWYDEINVLKIKEMRKFLEKKFSDNEYDFKFTGI